MEDDNEKILELIQERMAIGEERYGHGIRKNDDTTQWGTKTDSWTEMGLEEALDLTIYLSAQLLRILDKEEERKELDKRRIEHVLKMAKTIKRYEMIHAEAIRDRDMPHPHECTCGGSRGCQLYEPNCLTIKFHEADICDEYCHICQNPDDFPLL
ncbi:MAG: hypothetical protein CMB45_06115 [Euryarchaeota archaeon]|nr:hypothetical protein [Euryarchaeota archaeon]